MNRKMRLIAVVLASFAAPAWADDPPGDIRELKLRDSAAEVDDGHEDHAGREAKIPGRGLP